MFKIYNNIILKWFIKLHSNVRDGFPDSKFETLIYSALLDRTGCDCGYWHYQSIDWRKSMSNIGYNDLSWSGKKFVFHEAVNIAIQEIFDS